MPDGAGNVAARTLPTGSPTPPNQGNFSPPSAAARGTEAWVVSAGLGLKGIKWEALTFFHPIGLVAEGKATYALTYLRPPNKYNL